LRYLIDQGGIVIYPLLLSSLISLTIILERLFFFLRTPMRLSDNLMSRILQEIKEKNIDEAVRLCDQNGGPVGLVLKRGILFSEKGLDRIEKVMEEIKWDQFPRFEKRLEVVNFIGKISPSLGLLGTVTGMIKTFHVLSLSGEPQRLAGGISEALLTTAVGLVISIPSLGAYYYFINKIEKMVNHTEKREMELINFLDSQELSLKQKVKTAGKPGKVGQANNEV